MGRTVELHRINLENEVFIILSIVAMFLKKFCKRKSHVLNIEIPVLSNLHLSDMFIVIVVKDFISLCVLYFIRYLSTLSCVPPPSYMCKPTQIQKTNIHRHNTDMICVTNRNPESFHL